MKLESIRNTAVCYWSDEDDCYVVESSLFLRTAGIGDTEKEAWAHFEIMLNDIYPELKAGRVVGFDKPGRPAKGGVDLHAQVKPDTKDEIAALAEKLGISQGEAVDYLLFFHNVRKQNQPSKQQKTAQELKIPAYEIKRIVDQAVSEPLQEYNIRLRALERQIKQYQAKPDSKKKK